jgi:hypothetical protein
MPTSTSTFVINKVGMPLFLGYMRTCTLFFSSKPMKVVYAMMKKKTK